jgi:hypothetical protein
MGDKTGLTISISPLLLIRWTQQRNHTQVLVDHRRCKRESRDMNQIIDLQIK